MLGVSVYAQNSNAYKQVRMQSPVPGRFAKDNNVKQGAKTLPNWTAITQDVTGTDFLTNATVSTASIRNAGKGMVIDFSATWCSWCWVMHQNGILDAIQTQLGTSVQPIWVEADPSTTNPAELTGTGTTQGNWTLVYGTNNTVPYPIINDHNFTNIIGGTSMIDGYPTVVFVSPTGYWCDVYSTDWGFGPYSASDAVSAIATLMDNYPQPGVAPTVQIEGYNTALVNSDVTFTANIVSVDQVTDISWTVDGTPVTGNNNTLTYNWSTTGSKTISVTVTNTTGSTTATMNVTVFEWNWGNTIDYPGNGAYQSSIGFSGNGEIQWGFKVPASLMTGRNYLENVQAYIHAPGTYDVRIYQGNGTTAIYDQAYNVTVSEQWFTFPIYDVVALDDTQDLYVSLHTNGVSYPAAYTTFCGDPNASLLVYQGAWTPIMELADFEITWMIKATTSATVPAMTIDLNGPTSGTTGNSLTFTVVGPSDATYTWTLQGATPSTATGTSATAIWNAGGTYTVSVTATRGSETATASTNVTIRECSTVNLPYTMGFESNESTDCFTFIDADNDGYGWDLETWNGSGYSHTGDGVAGSASFINDIGVLTPDNWMILPKMNIPAGGATITWWVGGVDASFYAEKYSVLLSTTGTNPSDFTTTLFSGTVSSVDFTKKTANISASGEVYIAFRHHDIEDIYWMLIDDIEVKAGTSAINSVSENQANIYPNPTSGMVSIDVEGLQSVEVMDMSGRTVMTANQSTIDMSNLNNGVYMFRINTENGSTIQKVVKK